ncbi:MAG: LysR substrate-binding domain-containing protein [Cyanobacteria bacterium P01_E01_bin.42]
MKTDIELRHLRYFVVVAEELNFTRAAERLLMAQPPLSRQIRSLEKILEVELFDRTHRQIELTAAGAAFLVECRQILYHVERSVQTARRVASGETSKLIVGFEGSSPNGMVLKVMREFRLQFPEVELILQEMPSSKQVEALQRGKMDVGFIASITATTDIKAIPFVSQPLIAALPETHPLAREQSLDLGQLARESWITGRSDEGCGLLMGILEACHQAGFIPNVRQETNDTQMILSLVASGLGVTLLPESALSAIATGITYLPLQPPTPEVKLAIAWQPDLCSPVLKSFLQVFSTLIGVNLPV